MEEDAEAMRDQASAMAMAAQAASVRASTHLEGPTGVKDGTATEGADGASVAPSGGRVIMQVNPMLEAAVEFTKVKLQ